MKKMMLTALVLAALTMTAVAQPPQARQQGSRSEMHQHGQRQQDAQTMALKKAKFLQERLRLTEDQYNKVFKLYQKELEALEVSQQKGQSDAAQKKAMHDRISKKMKSILSDVQFAEWQQLEMRQHAHGPQAHHGMKVQSQHEQKAMYKGGKMHKGAPVIVKQSPRSVTVKIRH